MSENISRRSFLGKTAAAAGSATTLSGCSSLSDDTNLEETEETPEPTQAESTPVSEDEFMEELQSAAFRLEDELFEKGYRAADGERLVDIPESDNYWIIIDVDLDSVFKEAGLPGIEDQDLYTAAQSGLLDEVIGDTFHSLNEMASIIDDIVKPVNEKYKERSIQPNLDLNGARDSGLSNHIDYQFGDARNRIRERIEDIKDTKPGETVGGLHWHSDNYTNKALIIEDDDPSEYPAGDGVTIELLETFEGKSATINVSGDSGTYNEGQTIQVNDDEIHLSNVDPIYHQEFGVAPGAIELEFGSEVDY